jgi:hypothetical protein
LQLVLLCAAGLLLAACSLLCFLLGHSSSPCILHRHCRPTLRRCAMTLCALPAFKSSEPVPAHMMC